MLQEVSAAGTDTARSAHYPSLADKRVFISGGGSGIGAGLVEAFARQGARVAFVDIADAPSRALVETISAGARHAPRFDHCDITDLDAFKAAIGAVERDFGGIDVLINNAANDARARKVVGVGTRVSGRVG